MGLGRKAEADLLLGGNFKRIKNSSQVSLTSTFLETSEIGYIQKIWRREAGMPDLADGRDQPPSWIISIRGLHKH